MFFNDFLEEYGKPMLSFGLIVSLVILRWWASTAKSSPRSDAEREQLRSRLVEAARKRFTGSTPTRQQGNNLRQRRMVQTERSVAPEAPKAPRQATAAEELRYREEKLSQQQFGFSIYGNTDYCFDCVTPDVTSSRSSGFGLGIHSVGVIPDLPGSAQVYKELERLRDEFDPIVKARGWKVLNLTEMCCCGDGDITLSGKTSRASRQEQAKVMGYCVSHNDNRIALGIHIRCRVVGSCQSGLRLYPYEELVQTMVRMVLFACFRRLSLPMFLSI